MKHSFSFFILLASSLLAIQGCSLFSNSSNQTNTAASVQSSANSSGSAAPAVEAGASASAASNASSGVVGPIDNPPVSGPELQEQSLKDLNEAHAQLDNAAWSQAFGLATASYVANPGNEAKYIAMYAASQLTPIELKRLENKATTHFEQAILGEQLLVACASQKDSTCVEEILSKTVQSLEMLGDQEHAQQLRTVYGSQSASMPTVAVFLPLSGNDRKIGRAMLGAIIQASGVYHHKMLPFALRFFDTKSSVQTIPQIMSEAQALGANLILGPIDVRESAAAAKALTGDTALISFSPNEEYLQYSSRANLFSYSLDGEMQTLAQLIVSINGANIAVVGPEDVYVNTASQNLQSNLSVQKVFTLTFPAAQTDLRDLAKKVAKQNPDVVVFPTSSDAAERIASFLAQENLWCKRPGTPQPNAKVDARRFVTCLSTSAWSPIAKDHAYKFIVDAIYLDYAEAATSVDAQFSANFEKLYHRAPSVHEVLPYMAVSILKSLPSESWKNPGELQNRLSELMPGHKYQMLPALRQVTSDDSVSFVMQSTMDSTPSRTIVAPK
ncbi:MAG: hypothetical protein J6A01_02655 [Proteobacteria bacterium]|nr:hypothetical protein [Pseudomonadota bacterium]